jgi:hypothetical protein
MRDSVAPYQSESLNEADFRRILLSKMKAIYPLSPKRGNDIGQYASRRGMVMVGRLEQVVEPYYCRLALMLCQQAREMLYGGVGCDDASELCKFISTLCVKNSYSQCQEESRICENVSKKCLHAESVEEAKELCDIARRACPRSFSINGS